MFFVAEIFMRLKLVTVVGMWSQVKARISSAIFRNTQIGPPYLKDYNTFFPFRLFQFDPYLVLKYVDVEEHLV